MLHCMELKKFFGTEKKIFMIFPSMYFVQFLYLTIKPLEFKIPKQNIFRFKSTKNYPKCDVFCASFTLFINNDLSWFQENK
ncbi:hypothetical protein BpHYR1_017254 [Brachionus plicatilis]|uniref:Uncharacterized protein n=1 Tax=Brachionus plicatilis TaxID=10195 RepID=A0A3M7Q5K5_BRAPC|nr:hypothetical protein BpHYR1_017254 [Brachionus plicatilis]